MISDNSAEAYCKAFNTHKLDTLRYRVYLCIASCPGLTDEEISTKLQLPINTITGRVGELYKRGLIEFDNVRNQRNNSCRCSYIKGARA